MSDLRDLLKKQAQSSAERDFHIFMANARNTLRAVRIAIEEGDISEALRLIDDALDDNV